jgi:metal-dependent amidase/aminoacylase/carboxypeptidase family protein
VLSEAVRRLLPAGRDGRSDLINRVKRTATNIASSAAATADAALVAEMYEPSVYNDPNLAARMRPTLQRVAGKNHLVELPVESYSDDFAYEEKSPDCNIQRWIGTIKKLASWGNANEVLYGLAQSMAGKSFEQL